MAINFLDGITLVGTTNSTLTATTSSLYLLNLTRTTTSFTTAGNIGIGTTAPVTRTHILRTSKIDDAYGLLLVENTSTSSGSSNTNSGINVKNYHGTSQFMQWQNIGLRIGSRVLTNSGAGNVVFTAGSDSEKMRITSSGNVGVGNTAPSQKLTVAGTIMSTATSNPTLILQDTTHSDITIKGDSGIFSVTNQAGHNITMPYNGNVGIGNTAPTTKLEVNGRTQTKGINSIYIGNLTLPVTLGWYRVMEWTGSSRGGSVMCLSLTGGNFAPVTYIIKAYKTYGNPAGYNTLKLEQFGGSVYINKARITYDSGLGKAFVEVYRSFGGSNTMPFQVHQDKLIGYDATSTALVGTAAAGGGQVLEELPFVAEGTAMEKLLISDSIAVGNITNSATVGRIDAANDVVAYSTSDIRLKNNVKSIDKALDKVNSIQGIEFDWIEKEEVHGNSGHDIGVIAQEIEKILPDVVTTRDSGYKAVKYEKIVPLLIEAIKDLSKQVDGLKRLI